MKPQVKIVFASGTDELNAQLVERMRSIYPDLPLWVVSEFPPADPGLRWIRYQIERPLRYNLARCRYAIRGVSVRLAAVMLQPRVPLRRLRLLALLLAPRNAMFFNEELNHFMLRPRSVPAILRHGAWRARNYLRWRLSARPPLKREIQQQSSPTPTTCRGRPAANRPRILVVSPYVPFPLSHGGAVRIYNLMRRAAADFDQMLVAFTESADPPARELLDLCAEIVLVPRAGSHLHPRTDLPDTVQEFDSPEFRNALRRAVRSWQPRIAQLEFTQMAQYAVECRPARTILVEHDITFDLYRQLLALEEDWDLAQQLKLWERFEAGAWRQVDRVVVMSERDRRTIDDPKAAVLPNGVDLERFAPSTAAAETGRLLFIGSFAHLPNLLALDFFLREIWPRLQGARLHVIAGANHPYYLERSPVRIDLDQAGIEVEGFVADVRDAYRRAAVVIAPLRASAGTNIKILEAMAMGKAIVSTRAGVNGLDLSAGEDFLQADSAGEFAAAVERLLDDTSLRTAIGTSARRRVERDYNWDAIAGAQAKLYGELNKPS